MAFQAGDRIGDYEVAAVLGTGGMGQVYQVRNLLSNRIEAMKVVLPDLAQNTDLADRFLREIRVQASLDHPNIAALHTAQRVDNQVLMFMEFVDGNSAEELLRRGPIPREWGLTFIAQVLDALEYAHARGVIHRDIKPANIMVTQSGLVKLMDFGIAKLTEDRKLTSTGSTLGSLYYMSPEQIQGADTVDERSDIYSLGVCLYEIVTGKRPFEAPSEYSLMSAHLQQPARPPMELDASVPESLNAVILMAIAKDPQQRFQSARAMHGALNSVRQELGFNVEPPPAAAAMAAATSAVPIPPAAKESESHRGLYIGLGSLVTAGLIVGGLFVIPKYYHTGASPTAAVPAATPAPATTPATPPPAEPAPVVPANAATAAAPAPAPVPATIPLQRLERPPAPAKIAEPVKRAERSTSVPASPSPAPPPAARPDLPQQVTAPAPAPGEPPPSRAAMNELREQYNQLAIRAGTAKGGLQSLQHQMGALALRADMREAAVRVDYLMQEAMASLRAGDAEGARRNMDLADRTIERIEKFLGR